MITPKLKTPLHKLTRFEREKAIKKLQGQNDELLNEMGQESDLKALDTVQRYYKEQQEDEEIKRREYTDRLQKLLRSKQGYQRYLCNILQIFLLQEDLPKSYTFTIESNDNGIVLIMNKSDYHMAFSVTGIPKYDINACKITAIQAGNTVARLLGNFQTTKDGIIITTKEETELVLSQHGDARRTN